MCSVWGCGANMEPTYAFLHSLRWSRSLVSDLVNKHLPCHPGTVNAFQQMFSFVSKVPPKMHRRWFDPNFSQLLLMVSSWKTLLRLTSDYLALELF